MATGELADPLLRDLISDRLTFDELGWRGLWAYLTEAPPRTAIHHARFEGWTPDTHVGAESLSEIRELLWRYTAVHFERGKDLPFPQRVPHPGDIDAADSPDSNLTWETVTADQMISPEVRALLEGA